MPCFLSTESFQRNRICIQYQPYKARCKLFIDTSTIPWFPFRLFRMRSLSLQFHNYCSQRTPPTASECSHKNCETNIEVNSFGSGVPYRLGARVWNSLWRKTNSCWVKGGELKAQGKIPHPAHCAIGGKLLRMPSARWSLLYLFWH